MNRLITGMAVSFFIVLNINTCFGELFSANDTALQNAINKYTHMSINDPIDLLNKNDLDCDHLSSRIKNLYTIDNITHAMIEYNNSDLIDVKEGDILTCGEHVEKITLNKVIIKVDGHDISLSIPELK